MESKFNELMILLNDKNKESQLRHLFNISTNLQRIQLMSTIQEFLGIPEKDTIQLFKEIVLK